MKKERTSEDKEGKKRQLGGWRFIERIDEIISQPAL
jgi:hypothetical protein